jgi:pantoate kinase
VIGGDDRCAAAEPAERLAEREMKIERKIARLDVVRGNGIGDVIAFRLLGKMRGRRIRRVPRSGDVVLLDQVQIDFQCFAHVCEMVGRGSGRAP